jgi:hypothetical protein
MLNHLPHVFAANVRRLSAIIVEYTQVLHLYPPTAGATR